MTRSSATWWRCLLIRHRPCRRIDQLAADVEDLRAGSRRTDRWSMPSHSSRSIHALQAHGAGPTAQAVRARRPPDLRASAIVRLSLTPPPIYDRARRMVLRHDGRIVTVVALGRVGARLVPISGRACVCKLDGVSGPRPAHGNRLSLCRARPRASRSGHQPARAGRPLDRSMLREAIRQADLQFVHQADSQRLADAPRTG